MARWNPGSKERLQAAAYEAISVHGFDAVTVAEIAAAAGVTERTFFRYFADKREVLFGGQGLLVDTIVREVSDAPTELSAAGTVRYALDAAVRAIFPAERHPQSRARGAVIDADPALVERESLKMRTLVAAVSEALRARGIGEPEASLVAMSSIGVFEVAFRHWIAGSEQRTLADIQDAMFEDLGSLLGGEGLARMTDGNPA